ncbi:MAG TPA: YbdD/YjiX family protein [Burkholderiales bacterium]|nr:YbdD/YjiX family protein [Burkholderiales bacterium]
MRSERIPEERSGGYRALARVRDVAARAQRVWRVVFGVPDYDAYLAHMQALHPREPRLGRGEYLAWALERKYAGRGPRCC